MIKFDPKTIASWKERNITAISCIVTNTGCAGHKIRIQEGRDALIDFSVGQDGMTLHISEKDWHTLDGSMITWTGKKWILTSNSVNTRCGCGSSFSLKTGNPLQDKVAQMKLAIKEKKEGIHA